MKTVFKGAISAVKTAFAGLWGSIKGSLDKVVSGIKQKASQAKEYLQKLNPFKRNSPSLVDNVKAGTAVIRKTYASLADMRIAPPQIGDVTAGYRGVNVDTIGSSAASTTKETNINIASMSVRSEQDVRSVSKELFNLQRNSDRAGGR
jgi:hypothetical protein